jgi:hypothetical protein
VPLTSYKNTTVLYHNPQILEEIDSFLPNCCWSYLSKPLHREKIIHLISYLYLKPIIDSRYDRSSFIHLSQKNFLVPNYGRDYYKRILNALEYYEIIEYDPSYRVGLETKSYRLSQKYSGLTFSSYPLKPGTALGKKLAAFKSKMENENIYGTAKGLYVKLKNEVLQLSIDYSGAKKYVMERTMSYLQNPDIIPPKPINYFKKGKLTIPKKLTPEETAAEFSRISHQCFILTGIRVTQSVTFTLKKLKRVVNMYMSDMIAIDMIHNKQFFHNPDRNGRFHTNLTNLNSDLRRFLKFRGKNIMGTDIRNSQPLFFALVLMDRFKGKDLPEDVKKYIGLCLSGQFYNHLMDEAGIPQEERKKFKTGFFKSVMFNRTPEKKWPKQAKAFKLVFPNVWDVIVELKSNEQVYGDDAYKELANILQQKEQLIMIIQSASECFKRKIPILTLHDALYCSQEHIEEVSQIILSKFADTYGVTPTLEIG